MAKHYRVTIKVAYDTAHPIPDDMAEHLRDNVDHCVQRCELLNDVNRESVVEEWSVEAETVGTVEDVICECFQEGVPRGDCLGNGNYLCPDCSEYSLEDE